MSQRDCGCPGLVTPTLDELLAVAQHKPLPRVRVRDRRPPPARLGATLKGWMAWRLVDRKGREVAGGEGPNLILDQGLDLIATTEIVAEQGGGSQPASWFPIIRYCAVGTDSTTPDPAQTGLGSEVARTGTTFQNETFTRPSPGVYRMTRFIEFDYSVANGNLTEWGFSASASTGSNLFNRALFTDDEGDPDVVTKTDQEKLRLSYTLEVSLSPVSLTAGSFDITGVGTVDGSYMLLGGSAPPSDVGGVNAMRCVAPDLKLFSGLAQGTLGSVTGAFNRVERGAIAADDTDRSGITYTTNVSLNNLQNGVDRIARDTTPRDAYAPGSFERIGGTWKFETNYGTFEPIRAFFLCGAGESYGTTDACTRAGYVFDLDMSAEFSKDDEHTLTIGVPTVSWGRAP